MTKWFEEGVWPDRLKDGFDNMPEEHKTEFFECSWQAHLKAEYEAALAITKINGKPWEELTQEEKDRVESAVRQNAAEMQEFGNSLHKKDYNG